MVTLPALLDDCRLLARVEIAAAHACDVRSRVLAPAAHRVRVLPRVLLDGGRYAAVRVAFAQHGIDGAAEHLRVFGLDRFVGLVARLLLIVGDGVPLLLQLLNGAQKLRHGSADVRQLDDVRLGGLRDFAELREIIGHGLLGREVGGELRQDPPGEGDIACLDGAVRRFRERLHDRQQRIGGERRRLVRQRVDDLVVHGPLHPKNGVSRSGAAVVGLADPDEPGPSASGAQVIEAR